VRRFFHPIVALLLVLNLAGKRLERGTSPAPHAIESGARSIAIEAAETAKILEGITLPSSKRRVRSLAA
jgi:hypothetical protein